MASRRRIRSKKHARRRKKNQRRRWGIYTGAVLFLLALLVGVTHWSAIQVKDITVTTGDGIESELVVDVAENTIHQPWLWGIISRDNILLLPWREVRSEVQGISPRIKSVDLGLAGLRRINITVENRQPVAQVCQPVSGESSDCKVVDKTGFVFADSEEFPAPEGLSENQQNRDGEVAGEQSEVDDKDSSGFRYIMDSRPVLGRQFLPTKKFKKLENLLDQLDEIGMQADRLIIGEHGDFIIPVTSAEENKEQSVDLKMNINEDLLQAVSNLKVATENRSFKPEDASSSTESISPFALEYIDLRFDNKIFYQ